MKTTIQRVIIAAIAIIAIIVALAIYASAKKEKPLAYTAVGQEIEEETFDKNEYYPDTSMDIL